MSFPVTARVMSNGAPRNSVSVNFSIVSGSGSLSPANAVTDANGYAGVTLSVTSLSGTVQGLACVAPGNFPCAVFYVNPVPLSQQGLQQVAGSGQVSTGQAFLPVVVRVVDSAASPHPVMAAPVNFLTTVLHAGGMVPGWEGGDPSAGNPAMPVILKVTPSNGVSDVNGLASITPSSAGFVAPVEVDVSVAAGTSAFIHDALFVMPAPPSGSGSSTAPVRAPIAIAVERFR